jgi:hypothetical protein
VATRPSKARQRLRDLIARQEAREGGAAARKGRDLVGHTVAVWKVPSVAELAARGALGGVDASSSDPLRRREGERRALVLAYSSAQHMYTLLWADSTCDVVALDDRECPLTLLRIFFCFLLSCICSCWLLVNTALHHLYI